MREARSMESEITAREFFDFGVDGDEGLVTSRVVVRTRSRQEGW